MDTVVISTQHSPEVSLAQIREDMIEQVVKKVIPSHLLDENTKYFINPTGRFVIGGPHGDSGLTGRKIIVDTYGGIGRHGGGAFSGKDPTKVDRSGAYAARWVAKNIVAAGLAKRCEIQLAYAIGVAEPVSIMVETFGTGVVGDDVIEKAVRRCSTCVRRRSSSSLTCASRSTSSWQPTATWAARSLALSGRTATRPRHSRHTSTSEKRKRRRVPDFAPFFA